MFDYFRFKEENQQKYAKSMEVIKNFQFEAQIVVFLLSLENNNM